MSVANKKVTTGIEATCEHTPHTHTHRHALNDFSPVLRAPPLLPSLLTRPTCSDCNSCLTFHRIGCKALLMALLYRVQRVVLHIDPRDLQRPGVGMSSRGPSPPGMGDRKGSLGASFHRLK